MVTSAPRLQQLIKRDLWYAPIVGWSLGLKIDQPKRSIASLEWHQTLWASKPGLVQNWRCQASTPLDHTRLSCSIQRLGMLRIGTRLDSRCPLLWVFQPWLPCCTNVEVNLHQVFTTLPWQRQEPLLHIQFTHSEEAPLFLWTWPPRTFPNNRFYSKFVSTRLLGDDTFCSYCSTWSRSPWDLD